MKDIITLYRKLLLALPSKAKQFLNFYSYSLGALAIFDAIALGLLALVIAPISTGSPVSLPLIGELSETQMIWVLALICFIIVAKGVASVALLWWATRRFARYELEIGNRLFQGYLHAPWATRLQKNSSDLVRLTDGSVTAIVNAFLLPGATLFGELMSLIAIVLVLAVAAPLVALTTLFYLGAIGLLLYFWIARNARIAGRVNLEYSLKTSRLITEMVAAMKEITLRAKTPEVIEEVSRNRKKSTRARANIQFLGQVPRFVLESAIIGGFLLIGGVGYLTGGMSGALTFVALFGLAGFRMAPSVIRFQAVISQMTSSSPHVHRVLNEIESTEQETVSAHNRELIEYPADANRLSFENVSFTYPGSEQPAIKNVSLTIKFGETVAFVGTSGSGKSTMIDLLLGLLSPSEGVVRVNNTDIRSCLTQWQERLGYVPQEVALFDGNVAQNVALSWTQQYDAQKVVEALKDARLYEIIKQREGGITGAVGERGMSLSGGQKQRLGIARALYAQPQVLVMDEATSALDAETEAAVTQTVKNLHLTDTVVTVAHRLSTVMHADKIFYFENGYLIAQGNFLELQQLVPDFARQAELSGLGQKAHHRTQ